MSRHQATPPEPETTEAPAPRTTEEPEYTPPHTPDPPTDVGPVPWPEYTAPARHQGRGAGLRDHRPATGTGTGTTVTRRTRAAGGPWATLEEARAHWPDAASLTDETLSTLLDVATIRGQTYAPPVDVVPLNYMLGCVYDAREIYAAGQRDGDVIGFGDYVIRARPLTGTVRTLYRPEADPYVVA